MIPEKILKILKTIANSPNEDTIINLEDTGEDLLDKNQSNTEEQMTSFDFKRFNPQKSKKFQREESSKTLFLKKSEIIEFHHKDSPKIKFYMFQYEKTYSIFVLIRKKLYDLDIQEYHKPKRSQKPIFPEKDSLIFPQDLIRHATRTEFFQSFIEYYTEKFKKIIIKEIKKTDISNISIEFLIPRNMPQQSHFKRTQFKECFHIALHENFQDNNITEGLSRAKILQIEKETYISIEFPNLKKNPQNYHEIIEICKKIDEEVLEIKEKLLQFQNL